MTRIALAVAASLALAVAAPAQNPGKGNDIVAVAAGNKDFSTLVKAVKEAELVDTLKGEGPFTVFAPTNKAFDKLGKDTLDAVLADKEKLKKILLAHVIVGKKVMAKDAMGMDGEMVNGFKVEVKKPNVMIGGAEVVKADVSASNGVIHVIDTVLVPAE